MVQLGNKPELLAPVGDFERLEAAVRYGADAVYLGSTEYGMRAASANFTPELLKKAVEYAHGHGVKVYLTCNILPRSGELAELPAFLREMDSCGVDAYIVTDIGVLSIVKETLPHAEIHISTQTGIVNYRAAAEYYKLGAKRVVLARELTLEEIREIRKNTPPELELEVFVHGAMCMSFSGRCLLSNYMTGRDANRGMCAQPCRWNYRLVEEKRPGQYFPVFEDETGSYILNAKDLCMLEHINEVIEAGAVSLKIEGRAKSSYYVAAVTNAYRIAIDSWEKSPESWECPAWLSEEVRKVSHRDYSTGFYYGRPEQGQRYENGGYIREWDIVALVNRWESGTAYCTQKNKFLTGDELEILEPGKKPEKLVIDRLYNRDGEEMPDTRYSNEPFSFRIDRELTPGSILRKQAD